MKCVCGYEYHKDKAKFGGSYSIKEGTRPFKEVEIGTAHSTDFCGIHLSGKEMFYVCPVCGTIKMEFSTIEEVEENEIDIGPM